MATFEETLKSINATKILDVATGRGDFLFFLKENLRGFGTGTGVDIKKSEAWASNKESMDFREMDAARLDFADGSFDLVSMSNSLHHMPQPAKVLAEMARVLSPGGVFLFYEMYTDRQTPAQQTHNLLHQWWGKIDTATGVFHASPNKREELVRSLKETGITAWEYFDEADLSSDPFEAGLMEELDKIITSYQKKTTDQALIDEGEELRKRIKSVGFHSATELVAIGRKS